MSEMERQRSLRMDREKSGRGMLGFRCRKRLIFSDPATEKTVLGSRKRDDQIAGSSADVKLNAAPANLLPEKYAVLESFYEGVEGAVSLLDIRRQLCTFEAVCAAVEATTKRRFLQKHLAQIKYILPEAVDLEYVRSYDSDMRSVKWELKVLLLPMPAEAEGLAVEGVGAAKRARIESVQRRRAFHARLVKFASSHSEEDDVPAHPMPERNFNESLTASNIGTSSAGFSVPAATTCIPMDINSASHRGDLPKSDRSPALSSHFSKSFSSCFSLKAGGSFIRNVKKTAEVSPAGSSDSVRDTILPMPVNRTSHRDVHNVAGIPHLAPPFKPFFSVKRSSPEPELVSDQACDDSEIPDTSVQHASLECRHDKEPDQEETEIVEPVELRTPMKIIRSCGTPRPPTARSEYESPSKRPHFSPAFKEDFSVSSTRLEASSSIPSTPVKPSMISKDLSPISWDVRTPGRMADAVDQCSPVKESESSELIKSSSLKSSVPPHSFKSPAPVTSKKHHQHTPCTPQVSECGESSIYVSFHASQPGSACHGGFKSPAATPMRQGSAMRSLFGSPKSDSYPSSGVTGTPSMDVPFTPAMRTPMITSRGSRFHNKDATKQNLGSLFDRNEDEDVDCRAGGQSSSCITTASVSGKPTPRKSLSFASEVTSQADINLTQGLPAELVHS